ncbi:hypothetical protein DLAC_09056 [Tieghemostelium lacteum]|uniref:Nuclear control of ATPase protein 2 n=1 Tax=Tieghemostelium lacteum TaxID=361077 RepID=A0A151Z998_TIELA|nr:hypothetical protein DLAC_09056 [Tieghemostelium lacteum]|eukprot:KYQ90434.1 hypothetical protein DLAC_09056 [Tieghemostelium lacteum]
MINSYTHKKANIIKKNIKGLIPISNWTSLSLTHDNLSHNLDLNLLEAIKTLSSKDLPTTSSTTASGTTLNKDNNNNNNLINKITSIEHIRHHNYVDADNYSQGLNEQLLILEKLGGVFSTIGNLSALQYDNGQEFDQQQQQQQQQTGEFNPELDPSSSYKYGKHYVLANLMLDQLVVLLDFLFNKSLSLEESILYWESKIDNHHWYLIEKSPLYWIQFYRQQANNYINFFKKFTEIHHGPQSKSFKLFSSAITKFNGIFDSSLNMIHSNVDKLFKPSKQQQQQHNNGNSKRDQSEVHQQQQQTTEKSHSKIQHPVKELEERLKRLNSFKKVISICIGRLAYLLESIKNNISNITQLNIEITRSIIIIYDVIQILQQMTPTSSQQGFDSNHIINFNISQLIEYSKLLQQDDQQQFNLNDQRVEDYQENIYSMLKDNIYSIKSLVIQVDKLLKYDQKPSYFSRNWMMITSVTLLTVVAIKYSYDNMDNFKASIKDTKFALTRFYKDHLEEPLLNIWNVIRYDKKTLQLTDPVSLESSVNSLANMVIDYNQDSVGNILTSDQKEILRQLSVRGDISSVMSHYEKSIKSPIQSLLFGDLIRLILIQVQKEKVDVDKAMLAIDKLLQANELNFQLLAGIPAALFLALMVWQFKKLLTPSKKNLPHSQLVIFSTLRDLSRQLNVNPSLQFPKHLYPIILRVPSSFYSVYYNTTDVVPIVENQEDNNTQKQQQYLPFEQYGNTLVSTFKLKLHQYTKNNCMENQWFKQDIQDLESEQLSAKAKIRTINRMFSTFSFLKNK